MSTPVILKGTLNSSSLTGTVVIVTGAGRGIGFETAKALLHLGARVIIAEIDEDSGRNAAKVLTEQRVRGKKLWDKIF